MQFFEIDYIESTPRKFIWASGFGPMENMPFLHPVVLERRRAFWEVNKNMKPGIHIDNERAAFPDLLGNGHPPPSYFVSSRIVETLTAEGIVVPRITPCQIVEGTHFSKKEPARYFVLEAEPGIRVDWNAMGILVDPASGSVTRPYPKPWPPAKWIVRGDSWTGEDLFTWSNFKVGDFTTLLCTDRIRDLAKRDGWTNIEFKPFEVT